MALYTFTCELRRPCVFTWFSEISDRHGPKTICFHRVFGVFRVSRTLGSSPSRAPRQDSRNPENSKNHVKTKGFATRSRANSENPVFSYGFQRFPTGIGRKPFVFTWFVEFQRGARARRSFWGGAQCLCFGGELCIKTWAKWLRNVVNSP